MVSHLVTKEEANNTSEEEIVTTSKGPNVSERVSMAMQILRPTTAQMVLGTDALFLPYDHLLLQLVSDSVAVQGHVVVSSSGLVLTRLKLTIHMGDVKANTLVILLTTARAESPILEGVAGPIVLPDN